MAPSALELLVQRVTDTELRASLGGYSGLTLSGRF